MCVFTKKAPVCGGIVDKSDKKALKTIKSEKLTSFSVSFYLYGKLGRKTGSSYRISVVKNDAGRYVLSEEENNISCETDENYLKRIHEVIVKHNLVSSNGIHRYTSGLPVPFQPCSFTAEYESGEILSFKMNNDPESAWAGEILLLTGEEFARYGIENLKLS